MSGRQSEEEGNDVGLFRKYCPICGLKVKKNGALLRFGEHFCSEEHVDQFMTQIQKGRLEKSPKRHSHGRCC